VRRFLRTSRLLSTSLRRKLLHTALGKTSGLEQLYLDNFYCAFEQEDFERLVNRAEWRTARATTIF